jgi:uncharacterized Zn finger protein (UPF0148 family)
MSDWGTCPDCGASLTEVNGKRFCPHCDEYKPRTQQEPD